MPSEEEARQYEGARLENIAAHARSARLAAGGDVPDLMRSSEPSVLYRGAVRANLPMLARSAVTVGAVASVAGRVLLLPTLHALAPIRAPPWLYLHSRDMAA